MYEDAQRKQKEQTYHHFPYSGIFIDIPLYQIPLQRRIGHRLDLSCQLCVHPS